MSEFAKLIRDHRISYRFTQAEVAEAIGVSRPQYTNLETGRSFPSIHTAVRAAAFLKIDGASAFTALRLDVLGS